MKITEVETSETISETIDGTVRRSRALRSTPVQEARQRLQRAAALFEAAPPGTRDAVIKDALGIPQRPGQGMPSGQMVPNIKAKAPPTPATGDACPLCRGTGMFK